MKSCRNFERAHRPSVVSTFAGPVGLGWYSSLRDGGITPDNRAASQRTLNALLMLAADASRSDRVELQMCVLGLDAERILRGYEESLDAFLDFWNVPASYSWGATRNRILPVTQKKIADAYGELLLFASSVPPINNELVSFERELLEADYSVERYQVALARIFAPLVDFPNRSVERHWEEFSVDELRRFVELGIACERITLNRKGDVSRAQELGAKKQKLAATKRGSRAS